MAIAVRSPQGPAELKDGLFLQLPCPAQLVSTFTGAGAQVFDELSHGGECDCVPGCAIHFEKRKN